MHSNAFALAFVVLVFSSIVCLRAHVFCSDEALMVNTAGQGWQVDVFTQKQPYSGVGDGQPSDAFTEMDLVELFANVTYNGAGVHGILVAFSITGSPNPVENISLSLTAISNDVGIAESVFRILGPRQDLEVGIFGTRTVWAYIENASDFLTFEVRWLVQITSLQAGGVDPPQGGRLDVQVTLGTIALAPQKATLFIVLFDSSKNLIDSLNVENLTVDGGGLNYSVSLKIPLSTAVGVGILNASVYSPRGDPCCPGMSVSFSDFASRRLERGRKS